MILDESQMGFRPMRGCPDTTFVARWVLEEFRVTRPSKEMLPMMKECMPCSLIRKAFDSAPRETIWRILSSLGVPPGLVALVAELHKGMGACVRYHGTLNDRFSMRTGVRQGAVEAPTLWDLYFHFVVQDWRARVETCWGAQAVRSLPVRQMETLTGGACASRLRHHGTSTSQMSSTPMT